MSSEGGEGSSTSAPLTKEKMDAQLQAMNLLAQGKRNLICQEVPAAVQQFQDACQMLSATFGEMARECAEAYFCYGKGLLELSRMEQGVLGNALEGVDVDTDDEGGPSNKDQFEPPSKTDEEDRIRMRVQVVEAMSEDEISNQALLATGKKPETQTGPASFAGAFAASVQTDTEMETTTTEKDATKNSKHSFVEQKAGVNAFDEKPVDGGQGPETQDDEMSEDEDKPDEGKDGEEMEDTEEGDEEDEEEGDEEEKAEGGQENEEDADDISNLQLSWEMLDLARLIYSQDPSKESQLSAAEACLKLGEVSLESEQYDQAIQDLEQCLDIQRNHLLYYDRAIAETHYHLGLAYQMNKQLDKAKDRFTSAVECLEAKLGYLKKIVEEEPPKSPSQFIAPAESAAQEINQILEILPEIKEKIQDADEESKTMENLKMMAKVAMGSLFSSAAESTSETGFGTSSTGFGTSSTGFGTSSTGFGTSSTSPVKSTEVQKTSDISHLVRKKRKPDEQSKQEEDVEIKKAKQVGCGDASVNGVHQEKDGTSEAAATT